MKMQMYVQLKEKEEQQEQEHLIKQEERLMSADIECSPDYLPWSGFWGSTGHSSI